GEIDVLDAEPAALADAHAGAVEKPGEEAEHAVGALDGVEEEFDLLGGEDDGKAFGPAGWGGGDAGGVDFEGLAGEEDEGVEGLVLGGGGDVGVDGEVGEELADLDGAHVAWVTFVVKEDELAGPAEVALLGVEGVVAGAKDVAHLVEEAGWLRG